MKLGQSSVNLTVAKKATIEVIGMRLYIYKLETIRNSTVLFESNQIYFVLRFLRFC